MELNTTKYNYSEEVFKKYLFIKLIIKLIIILLNFLAEIDRKIPKQIGLFVTEANRNFETRLKGDNL